MRSLRSRRPKINQTVILPRPLVSIQHKTSLQISWLRLQPRVRTKRRRNSGRGRRLSKTYSLESLIGMQARSRTPCNWSKKESLCH